MSVTSPKVHPDDQLFGSTLGLATPVCRPPTPYGGYARCLAVRVRASVMTPSDTHCIVALSIPLFSRYA